EPDDRHFISQRGALLTNLGEVQLAQGKYVEARKAYEAGLQVDEQLGDLRGQAVDLGQLGGLALDQGEYTEAQGRFSTALKFFHALGEPGMEAVAWYNLGRVAQRQKEWTEAERCYREALALDEQRGDLVAASKTCNE